jgi:hypothetical protein
MHGTIVDAWSQKPGSPNFSRRVPDVRPMMIRKTKPIAPAAAMLKPNKATRL